MGSGDVTPVMSCIVVDGLLPQELSIIEMLCRGWVAEALARRCIEAYERDNAGLIVGNPAAEATSTVAAAASACGFDRVQAEHLAAFHQTKKSICIVLLLYFSI